jgi:hypothetical protein
MRLARDQQHPQPVAHAVDLHHGGVVAVGQLALHRGDLNCSTFMPPCGRVTGSSRSSPTGTVGLRLLAVDRDGQVGHRRPPGGHGALILDPQGQRQFLAQDGEGRGVAHDQPAVPVGRPPRSAAPAAARAGSGRPMSCTCPSVIRIAPATRARGSSASASASAVITSVPASSAPSPTRWTRSSVFGQRGDLGLDRSQRRLGLRGRSARRWLALSSTTSDHDVGQGARSSSCRRVGQRQQAAPPPPARAATSPAARATAPADQQPRASTASPAPASGRSGAKIRLPSLPQPFQQGRHMHLVGFVVARSAHA